MKHRDHCGVCGAALVYATETMPVKCHLCGKESHAQIYCPEGHYICNDCHRQDSSSILQRILASTSSRSPLEIAELIMANREVPMHGPEHHVIVPSTIVAAARNAGYDVPAQSLEQVISRSSQVPGGWCGFYGDCGAGVGVGIAVSVLTRATPLTGKPRSLAIAATSEALAGICDDGPRCCKRAVRKALETAIQFLDIKLGIKLDKADRIACQFTERNRECIRKACPYYPQTV